MNTPKLTAEQLLMLRTLQQLTESNIALKKAVDGLANSINDMVVVMEMADLEGMPDRSKMN